MNRADLPNPFDSDVVVNPNQPSAVDVRAIHAAAFDICRTEFERVRSSGSSRSILFNGQAGCGKTHLLSRFRRWLLGELETRPSAPPAAFVAVRMETAPSQVWRHLRQRFAEHLLDVAPDGTTVLDFILDRFAASHGRGDLNAAFEAKDFPDLTLDLSRVLVRFTEGSHRRLCRAWLKGDSLGENDRKGLQISDEIAETLDENSSESIARKFVLSLTRLCEPEPVVFCFDQLEALNISGSPSGAGTYTRMTATLTDETVNSLVISSALASYLGNLRVSSMLSDYQRMSRVLVDLHPLDRALGRQLVEARLESVAALKPYRASNGIEPLQDAELLSVFEEKEASCSARKLIHHAKRLFAAWQGSEIRKLSVEQFLETSLEMLREKSIVRSEPRQMDGILAHGLSRSAKVAGLRIVESKKQGIDFEAGPENAPILLALCNEPLATSVYHKLGRLRNAVGDQNVKRLCLIRDERLTIAGTAKATQDRLAGLINQGARIVRPDTEAVAAIDAMRLLLSQAASEDLSHEGEPVGEERVLAWLEANLPSGVADLLTELSGGKETSDYDSMADLLAELLRIRKVVSVDEAARELGRLPEQVVEYARSNPNQAGLVEGKTPVVFHVMYAMAGGPDGRP